MKEKYFISIEEGFQRLRIKELTDLEKKDVFIVICEEAYKMADMEKAISRGNESLIKALKTTNFYPTGPRARKIAEGVLDLYHSGKDGILEMTCDDKDDIPKRGRRRKEPVEEEVFEDFQDDETDELDGLFGEEKTIGRPGASIKIADSDQLNVSDDY